MGAVSIQQMTQRISALMGERYRVKGTLAERAARARRRLPAKVRDALETLVSAEHMAANPRLAPQIDMETVAAAYDLALKHLNGVNLADRRWGAVVGVAGSVAFSLLVVVVLLVAVLRWRGFI